MKQSKNSRILDRLCDECKQAVIPALLSKQQSAVYNLLIKSNGQANVTELGKQLNLPSNHAGAVMGQLAKLGTVFPQLKHVL